MIQTPRISVSPIIARRRLRPPANCTISLFVNPIGPGQRTANLTITDDAPGSPQTISLSGTTNPAFTVRAVQGSSTTASVTAGQSAQYQLQLMSGPGYRGSVSLTCSGAPLGATCQVPASVSISNGVSAPFTVTVTTSGSAVLPHSVPRRFVPRAGIRVPLLLALALVLLRAIMNGWMFDRALRARCLACSRAFAAIFLRSVIHAAGCGGGSAYVAPAPLATPPVITPSGTSTITVTMNAMSSSGKPLHCQPFCSR